MRPSCGVPILGRPCDLALDLLLCSPAPSTRTRSETRDGRRRDYASSLERVHPPITTVTYVPDNAQVTAVAENLHPQGAAALPARGGQGRTVCVDQAARRGVTRRTPVRPRAVRSRKKAAPCTRCPTRSPIPASSSSFTSAEVIDSKASRQVPNTPLDLRGWDHRHAHRRSRGSSSRANIANTIRSCCVYRGRATCRRTTTN